MTSIWPLVLGGAVVGLLYGLFGVGSAFATPVLSLLGVPAMAAVVGPLPALLPGSAAGAWSYARGGRVDHRLARTTLLAAIPAAVLGALSTSVIGGSALLVLSGTVLLLVGLRVVRPGRAALANASAIRHNNAVVLSCAAVVGFSSGLLANGGGFLLVPLFLVAMGLDMNEASGTSLVVAVGLTIPTLVTHIWIGDIDWLVSAAFAVGLVPAAFVGARLAQQIDASRLRRAFGMLLIGFALSFLVRQFLG